MKLVTYTMKERTQVGILDGDEVIPIPGIDDMITLLQDPSPLNVVETAVKQRTQSIPINEARLLAPIPRPPKIICLGLNYIDHAEETGRPIPTAPILFSKPHTAVIGPGDSIVLPKISNEVDFEVELAVIISEEGRHIQPEEAPDYIWGYTIFNDVTARDFQYRDGQWFRGKSFNTFAPMGPYLVFPDQIGDPHNLRLQSRLNGKTRQDGTSTKMVFSIPKIISDISEVMTLERGDVIATGTPAGVGFVAQPQPIFLQPGDIVEAEIEGIGTLRNPVVTES